MINDYLINKIYNQKHNFIFHICMLKLDESNTCSNDESTKFNKGVSIIMNCNLMDIYINKNMVPT